MLKSLFNKVAGFHVCEKVALTQMFSCEYCKIFKSNYFEEHPRTSASVHNFLVNALCAGLIGPSFENTLSMANLLVPVFFNFF